MAYDIELKNQTGESIAYNNIGEISIPLSDKSGEGIFSARHTVACTYPETLEMCGGDTCAFGVDYMAVFSSKEVITDFLVQIFIGGERVNASENLTDENVVVAALSETALQMFVRIPGVMIAGDIKIEVEI